MNLKKKRLTKKLSMLFLLMALVVTTSSAFALNYTNSHSYNASLPHLNKNTTVADDDKTTSRGYGKISVSSLGGGSKGVHCWLRTDGDQYDLDYLVSFTSPGTKTLYYASPYGTGIFAEARMENITTTQFFRDSVRGVAWLN